MKRILLALTSIICLSASAQIKMPAASPTQTLSQEFGMGKIDINYSRPGIKGRSVFGDGSLLAPNGVVWRTGANDATVFEVDADVKVEGQTLAKGSYSLFTIPEESEWTIIFNKKSKQWGSYNYKQEDDVLRVKVKPGKSASFNEALNIAISNGKVYIRWENLEVPFSVK
jgi:hypothetical protein